MLIEHVCRLALPRGAKPKCELCGQPAEFKCTACSGWFCSVRHFKIAWDGVLHLIYRELNQLQEKPISVGSERERQELEKRRKAVAKNILETSTAAAQTWVVRGNFKLAVAGALYAARTAEMLSGADSIDVVPAQLLLAEIYLGLNYLHSAEELLSMADRSLAKYPEASRSTRCSLYRNFGRLYASQNKYDQALRACATDVYFAACEFGAMDFRTVPSFFNMAEVFKKSGVTGSNSSCNALYEKICEIIMAWFEQVAGFTTGGPISPPNNSPESSQTLPHVYTGLEIQEATETMRRIVEHAGDGKLAGTKLHCMALCATGLIYAYAQNFEEAQTYIQKALKSDTLVKENEPGLLRKCEIYQNVIQVMQDRFSGKGVDAA